MDKVKGFVDFLFRNTPDTPEVEMKKEKIAAELEARVRENMEKGMDEKQALEAAIDGFDDLFSVILDEAGAVQQVLEEDVPLFPVPDENGQPENEGEETDEKATPLVINGQRDEEEPEEGDSAAAAMNEEDEDGGEDKPEDGENLDGEKEDGEFVISDFDPRSISSTPLMYIDEEEGRRVSQYKLWLAVSLITTPIVLGLVVLLYFFMPYIPFVVKNTVKHADLIALCASVGFLMAWPVIQYTLYAMAEKEPDNSVDSPGKDIIYSLTSWLILVMIFYIFNYIMTKMNLASVVWWPYCVVASFAYPLSAVIRLMLLKSGKFYKG